MRVNPGGILDPSDVVGRDRLIERLWKVLDRQSVVLTAERRLGKTSVVRKMRAEAPKRTLPLYRDLEAILSPEEFAKSLFRDVEEHLGRWKRTAAKARNFLNQLGGLKVGDTVKIPDQLLARSWKAFVEKSIEDLIENQEARIVFLWDETPLMLQNFLQRGGGNAAMELLDLLRSLRQMHPELRMVFTGSIGLHNLVDNLRRSGYANDPTNDMHILEVPPLDPDDAVALCEQLFAGEGLELEDPAGTANVVCASVDNVPYYIHHVVDQLGAAAERPITPDLAGRVVASCLGDPADPWHLAHYRDRLGTYYPDAEERTRVLTTLDAVAAAKDPLSTVELLAQVKSAVVTDDETVRALLVRLERDHYIVRHPGGGWQFRFSLIGRWWRLQRC